MKNEKKVDFVIIGSGLAGLSVAMELNQHAIILEQNPIVGGLVNSVNYSGYWFDRVLHLLYFNCKKTEARIKSQCGQDLQVCKAKAWTRSLSGTVQFPFQINLGNLPKETIKNCIYDLAKISFSKNDNKKPQNYEQWLLASFGESMCNDFMWPYNRKMWQRPLTELAPSNFQWNIVRPDFETVLDGAFQSNLTYKPYNYDGWYPRPPTSSKYRGMGYLAHELAKKNTNIHLNCTVKKIDLELKKIIVQTNNKIKEISFRYACISTIPLIHLTSLCQNVPKELIIDCNKLLWNRVRSIAISIRGPRPLNRGLWCYYADESIIFTRLIYMHEFDPENAPADGWGLLVEVTECAEVPRLNETSLKKRVLSDLKREEIIPSGCEIIDINFMEADPAYVVFTHETQGIVTKLRSYFEKKNLFVLGRYGRWEYSSMSQVLTDGFNLGESLRSIYGISSSL